MSEVTEIYGDEIRPDRKSREKNQKLSFLEVDSKFHYKVKKMFASFANM